MTSPSSGDLGLRPRRLSRIGNKAEQSQSAQLLKQLVDLQKQQLIARLRQGQANDASSRRSGRLIT
jgi:hypothetical protein